MAKRLRESGNLVIGIGEQKTPESFRASCEKFIYLDIIQQFISDIMNEKLKSVLNGNNEPAQVDQNVTIEVDE